MLEDYLLKHHTKDLEEILNTAKDDVFYSIEVK